MKLVWILIYLTGLITTGLLANTILNKITKEIDGNANRTVILFNIIIFVFIISIFSSLIINAPAAIIKIVSTSWKI